MFKSVVLSINMCLVGARPVLDPGDTVANEVAKISVFMGLKSQWVEGSAFKFFLKFYIGV